MILSSVTGVEVCDQKRWWILLLLWYEENWQSSKGTETAVQQFAEVIEDTAYAKMSGPIRPQNYFEQLGIPTFFLNSLEVEHIWLHTEHQIGVKYVLDFCLLFYLLVALFVFDKGYFRCDLSPYFFDTSGVWRNCLGLPKGRLSCIATLTLNVLGFIFYMCLVLTLYSCDKIVF